MTIVAKRWPDDLCPSACTFGRQRFDVEQVSPRTRHRTLIRRARPLWSCELSWSKDCGVDMSRLRYLLDGLDGFSGSVILWDFNCPTNSEGSTAPETTGTSSSFQIDWVEGAALYPFTHSAADFSWDHTIATIASGFSAGDTAIIINGLTPTDVVAFQGDYVQIGRRLYLLASDAVAAADGSAILTFSTPLLTDAPLGTIVRFQKAGCEMHLTNQKWNSRGQAANPFLDVSAKFLETVVDY